LISTLILDQVVGAVLSQVQEGKEKVIAYRWAKHSIKFSMNKCKLCDKERTTGCRVIAYNHTKQTCTHLGEICIPFSFVVNGDCIYSLKQT
jgi:hypothetical protein